MCKIIDRSRNITYFQECDDTKDILIYKDSNKNIVGEFNHIKNIGYIKKGNKNKMYKRKIWWLRAVDKILCANKL